MNHITTLSSLTLNQLTILHKNKTSIKENKSDPTIYFNIDDDEFKNYSLLKDCNWITTVELNYKTTTAGELAKANKQDKLFEIPLEFQKYASLFNKKKSKWFPPPQPYDHKINLKELFKLTSAKIYPLNPNELEKLCNFISKNLEKGYIWKSESPMSVMKIILFHIDLDLEILHKYYVIFQLCKLLFIVLFIISVLNIGSHVTRSHGQRLTYLIST
jgi:hypothetical protein